MARDPWWLFAYWEVTERRQEEILRAIRRERLEPDKTVMRVYELAGPGREDRFFDIEISVMADNWYLEVGLPGRRWVVELGVRTRGGRFFAWVRSNEVMTPRYGISDEIDAEWSFPEDIFLKIFKAAGAWDGFQKSSNLTVSSS
ncbi:MAG: DUF4912 domain-containing protein [Candidatus Omnitrophica bacterium]|nr:DUF4912 domain-containing protein [Candidatus Omnitrophota bacterium]